MPEVSVSSAYLRADMKLMPSNKSWHTDTHQCIRVSGQQFQGLFLVVLAWRHYTFFCSNSTGIFISQETYKYIKLARKNKKYQTSCMSLQIYLRTKISERNVQVKFEKSLGMPQTHLSNPIPSKVQRATPSIFGISRLQVRSTMA